MPRLTSTSLDAGAQRHSRQSGRLLIVVVEGPNAGTELVLESQMSVGTSEECELRLSDPQVSRTHLSLSCREGGVTVVDRDSKNGTFVGSTRLERGTIFFGSTIRIGSTVLKVLPEEEPLTVAPSEGEGLGALIGTSAGMRELFSLIERAAASSASVLIEGETGVGKELVAEEIHRCSGRSAKPFGFIDCGTIPDSLVESTLFGHRKGAFTGATEERPGLFREHEGGTVFLDEVAELSIEHQPALLRVLDRGMVRPVGSSSYEGVDVRIIAATHRHFGERIREGRFREDLYYRLAVIRLGIPPLRKRKEDIPLLVDHFLSRLGTELRPSKKAMEQLVSHSWPGNVRELRNAVERAVALADERGLHIDLSGPSPMKTIASDKEDGTLLSQSFRDGKAAAIDTFESSYLGELMSRHETITSAADAAGMDRKHLRVLLRRHGLLGSSK